MFGIVNVEELSMAKKIIVTTANSLDGYAVAEHLGVVRGIVVRAQTIGQGIRGALSSILGGNIKAFEEVCEHARNDAFSRMKEHASGRASIARDRETPVRRDSIPLPFLTRV